MAVDLACRSRVPEGLEHKFEVHGESKRAHDRTRRDFATDPTGAEVVSVLRAVNFYAKKGIFRDGSPKRRRELPGLL